MPKRVVIMASKSMFISARKLKQGLQEQLDIPVILINPKSTTYQGRQSDYFINWGCSKYPEFLHHYDTNVESDVALAVDKVNTFQMLQCNTLDWTTNIEVAKTWKGNIVCRANTKGFGGNGITLCTADNLIDAPLYVKYKKKKHEYRVHIFDDKVIDVTQKKQKTGNTPNFQIRNYKNGWVYCRSNIHIDNDLTELARQAMKDLGLLFGAVDIIWNEKENKYYVLEINTAPGLTGTTLISYINAFKEDILK